MRSPRLAIYGAGRVGLAIARRARACGVPLSAVWNPRPLRPERAELGEGLPLALDPSPAATAADLWLIAVPDDRIAAVAAALAAVPGPAPRAAAHCAGAHDGSLLAPLSRKGIACGSWHPVMTFRGAPEDDAALAAAAVAIEGDPTARPLLTSLADALGLRSFPMAAGQKPRYHAALVLASNGRVALDAAAARLLAETGLDPEMARSVLNPLVERTDMNLRDALPAEALTGPVARGDVRTVAAHLAALKPHPPLLQLYRALAVVALDLVPAEMRGDGHDQVATLMEGEPR